MGRADDDPGSRQTCRSLGRDGADAVRDAEVEQLDAVRGQEHVRWFEVAMYETAFVQGLQCAQETERDLRRLSSG